MSKKGFVPIVIVLIIAFLSTGVGSYIYFQLKDKSTAFITTTTIQPSATSTTVPITTTIQPLVITTTVFPITTTTVLSTTSTTVYPTITTTTVLPATITTIPPVITTVTTKQEVEVGVKVSGIISSDTTWNLENSPYIIIGDLLIEKGITLAVEPGVIVKFKEGEGKGNKGGFEIINKGNIIAKGNPSNKIIFTSLNPSPQLGDWGTIEIVSGGSVIFDYIEIKYASSGITIENALNVIITNSYIHDCGIGIFVNKGPALISNNLIEKNYAGISFMHIPYSGKFDDGTFHYQGLRETKIIHNDIQNNIGQSFNEYHAGIFIEIHDVTYSLIISHNNIYNNSDGINIKDTGGFDSSRFEVLTIKQNNIYNNKDYAVWFGGEKEGEVSMSNNWWGTIDLKIVNSLIYDYYDSFIPGKIDYQPIAASEIISAGVQ